MIGSVDHVLLTFSLSYLYVMRSRLRSTRAQLINEMRINDSYTDVEEKERSIALYYTPLIYYKPTENIRTLKTSPETLLAAAHTAASLLCWETGLID